MTIPIVGGLAESFSVFWTERDARERKMLSFGGLAVGLAVVYFGLIAPPLAGRTKLNAALPTLRQQAAELQALSKKATELANATAGAPPAVEVTKENLETTLGNKGLKAQSILLTGEAIKIQLRAVSIALTMTWLDEMQHVAHLSLTEAKIEALPPNGIVNATLTLRQPTGVVKDE
jgi:general secretion pathway protein M